MKKACILLGAWAVIAAAPIGAEVLDRIVASVDGEPITLYELKQFVVQKRALMPNLPAVSDQEALQALITEKLVAKEIVARGIRIRDEDIDHYIDRVKQQNHLDDERLKEALKRQGLEYSKYRQQIREEIEKVQLLNREIRAKVTISPEDVQPVLRGAQEGLRARRDRQGPPDHLATERRRARACRHRGDGAHRGDPQAPRQGRRLRHRRQTSLRGSRWPRKAATSASSSRRSCCRSSRACFRR